MADWGGHFFFFICIKVIFSEYHVVKRWNGHTHAKRFHSFVPEWRLCFCYYWCFLLLLLLLLLFCCFFFYIGVPRARCNAIIALYLKGVRRNWMHFCSCGHSEPLLISMYFYRAVKVIYRDKHCRLSLLSFLPPSRGTFQKRFHEVFGNV